MQEKGKLAMCSSVQTALEMLTGDFELLDCFVALILDFDFDWDCLPVEIELQTRTAGINYSSQCREKEEGFASVHLFPAKLLRGRAYQTS